MAAISHFPRRLYGVTVPRFRVLLILWLHDKSIIVNQQQTLIVKLSLVTMKCDMCDENLAVQCENAILLCVRAYFVAHAYVCYWSRTRYENIKWCDTIQSHYYTTYWGGTIRVHKNKTYCWDSRRTLMISLFEFNGFIKECRRSMKV